MPFRQRALSAHIERGGEPDRLLTRLHAMTGGMFPAHTAMRRWLRVGAVTACSAFVMGCTTGPSVPASPSMDRTPTPAATRSAQQPSDVRASIRALDAANGPPRLTVRPSSGLHNGQRVTVSAEGFWPGAKLFFSECPPGQRPSRATGCGDQAATEAFTITDDTGDVRGYRLKVAATVNGKPCQPRCVLAAIGTPQHLATESIRFN
jgi:hypothetical protein